jgi:hypothetical protein
MGSSSKHFNHPCEYAREMSCHVGSKKDILHPPSMLPICMFIPNFSPLRARCIIFGYKSIYLCPFIYMCALNAFSIFYRFFKNSPYV